MKSLKDAESNAAATPRGQYPKRVLILDAAAEVFCREGFSGACIDEIAAEACVSRQTVYNHYHEKETLFTAVVEDVMTRVNSVLFSTLSTFPDTPDNLQEELSAFAVRLTRDCTGTQDGKFLRKLVQQEGGRYPHLFEGWRQQGPCKTTKALAALFARLSHQGALEIDDFDLAARQFLALVNADIQMAILFGGALSDDELEVSAHNAVRTFLRAYGRVAERDGNRPVSTLSND
jgi:AcrR family transcriptional regulator